MRGSTGGPSGKARALFPGHVATPLARLATPQGARGPNAEQMEWRMGGSWGALALSAKTGCVADATSSPREAAHESLVEL
eukprot:7860768-Pyramimonas_sp.AAC.1